MTRDIQDRLDRYVAAFNGGDADAAAEAWADDAKQFPPAAPPAVGREAIREGIKAIQEMSPRLELRSTDVLVEGNVAIEAGTWSVKLQTPNGPVKDGGPPFGFGAAVPTACGASTGRSVTASVRCELIDLRAASPAPIDRASPGAQAPCAQPDWCPRDVASTDNGSWSTYGAGRSQPVATGRKSDGRENGPNRRDLCRALPPLASEVRCSGEEAGGWWPAAALDGLKADGAPDDACYPYIGQDQDCAGFCADWRSRATKISSWHEITRHDETKQWLSSRGPLVGTMTVYEDFIRYYKCDVVTATCRANSAAAIASASLATTTRDRFGSARTAGEQNGHSRNDTRDVSRRIVTAANGPISRRNCVARDRACPRVSLPNLHGKEGIDASSPSEGSAKSAGDRRFSFARACTITSVR
jgi:ketosteroid isomerase-like protein